MSEISKFFVYEKTFNLQCNPYKAEGVMPLNKHGQLICDVIISSSAGLFAAPALTCSPSSCWATK